MANCLLVYVPELPLRVRHLMPQEELALAAACLRDAGHTVRILDFGAVLDASTGESLPARRRVWPFFTGKTAEDDVPVNSFVNHIIDVIYSELGGLDLVAFLVNEREGLALSTKVNTAFQARYESARSVCFGPYAERFAPYISAFNPAFPAVATESPGIVMARLLDGPNLEWAATPGLMLRERGGAIFTGRMPQPERGAKRPLPDYSEAVYPQLHRGEKVLYFPVKHARSGAPSVMARARAVREQFPGAMLHFDCESAPAGQVVALARGVASLHAAGPCSMSLSVAAMTALAPEALRGMNCLGVRMEAPSGSQRLLDDFYAAGFTVSEAELAIRNAQIGGAATSVGMMYPCPWDDYHTRAESLRLVQRARPQGITISAPEVAPGTPWYASPEHFGFRPAQGHAARRAAGAPARQVKDKTVEALEVSIRGEFSLLGAAPGVDVFELACVRLRGNFAESAARAEALREKLATGASAETRALIAALNASLRMAPVDERAGRAGRLRAAIGN